MSNFWQILTAFGVGDTANKAGKAVEEARELKELQAREMESLERRHRELLELQKEQIKMSAMTTKQKRDYLEQKEKEEYLRKRLEAVRRFDPNDPVVRKAVEISLNKGKFSTAMLQTYLGKGHNFVMGLAVWLEEIGVIGPLKDNKPRDLLIGSMEEFDSKAEEYIEKEIANIKLEG